MSITINLPTPGTYALTYPDGGVTPDEFFQLCMDNPEAILEREADGQITIMAPVTFLSGQRENFVSGYVMIWSVESGLGASLSPSTGFTLPSTEVRSPDAAWVSDERLAGVSREELERFPKLVPDFIVEIRSKSDRLAPLKRKMEQSWMAHGVRLGWLIDVKGDQVFVYRAGKPTETVNGLEGMLSGEDVLPGFSFDLSLLSR